MRLFCQSSKKSAFYPAGDQDTGLDYEMVQPCSTGVILEQFFLFGEGIECRRFGDTVHELEPRSFKLFHDLPVSVF